MLGDGILSQTLLWPSPQEDERKAASPAPDLKGA